MKNLFFLLTILLFLHMDGVTVIAQGNVFSCLSETTPINYPTSCGANNCTIPAEKCVRIKFHYMNNTTDPTDNISDEEWRMFLDEINSFYASANVRFTFDDQCVHVDNITPNIGALDDWFFSSSGTFDPDPIMQYEYNAINVYIFQNPLSSGGFTVRQPSEYGIVTAAKNTRYVAHEIGHALGLVHTFGNKNIGDINNVNSSHILDYDDWECKNRTQGADGCNLTGDHLCDTGADPFAMDLDDDDLPDLYEWIDISKCEQIITADVADRCDDVTTEWDIPITNIMSQYHRGNCYYEFSPCQACIMHEYLSNSNRSAHFSMDCNNDPYYQSCTDINIYVPTTWTNQTVELCAGQKIIIHSTGSLTLDNTTLTRKVVDPNCPGLSGLWDGIYIIGGSNGVQMPGGPTLIGDLTVSNGSVIEYSENGITADQSSFGVIDISNSIMDNNKRSMHIVGPGGFYFLAKVNLTNTTITHPNWGDLTCIGLSGAVVDMDNTQVLNGSNTEATGIKAYDTRLKIVNGCDIQAFNIGVDKELDGSPYFVGIDMQNSKITGIDNQSISLRIRGSNANIIKNYFGNKVDVSEKAYGLWRGNNFQKQVEINDVYKGYVFEENYFDNSDIEIYANQQLTDFRCNQWVHLTTESGALGGKTTAAKMQWGNNQVSSGNKHNQPAGPPYMDVLNLAGDEITHFHLDVAFYPETVFTYDPIGGSVVGENADDKANCQYNLHPDGLTGGGGEEGPYDDVLNESAWQSYSAQFDSLDLLSQGQSDSILMETLAQMEDLAVAMHQCELQALIHSEELSPASMSNWSSRWDPVIARRQQMADYFRSEDYAGLSSYLVVYQLTVMSKQIRSI